MAITFRQAVEDGLYVQAIMKVLEELIDEDISEVDQKETIQGKIRSAQAILVQEPRLGDTEVAIDQEDLERQVRNQVRSGDFEFDRTKPEVIFRDVLSGIIAREIDAYAIVIVKEMNDSLTVEFYQEGNKLIQEKFGAGFLDGFSERHKKQIESKREGFANAHPWLLLRPAEYTLAIKPQISVAVPGGWGRSFRVRF